MIPAGANVDLVGVDDGVGVDEAAGRGGSRGVSDDGLGVGVKQ